MKQLSILVVNKAGSLREASTVLSDSGVNIRAVAAFDTPEFGILRMVVDDCEKAKDVLTQKGFVVRLNDVIGIELEDKKGNLTAMLDILADANISIDFIYSFVIRENQAPVIVIHTDDLQVSASMLKDHGFKVVDELE
ncbi:MAG TPA: ACT domain-containing protein [Candidatus Fimimorpha faecalis]|uniref:ACT domain-containing protein n=1 Tax=Candidatus Fimimorpha faecalis TaxID=2840824 RepID=A0A9D1JE10_9FIRM|nr:ACT domain-containing protein [Candidatus Fimimorpha faecalis]